MSDPATEVDMIQLTGFSSLPREIRDEIYKLSVVDAEPLYFIDSAIYPIFSDRAVSIYGKIYGTLDGKSLGPQWREEAREIFYAQNTFVVSSTLLPQFLSSGYEYYLDGAFRASSCVRKLRVHVAWGAERGHVYSDCGMIAMRHSDEALRTLLECPSLQYLDLWFWGRLPKDWEFERTSSIVRIKRQLREKLGDGLKIMERWYGVYEE